MVFIVRFTLIYLQINFLNILNFIYHFSYLRLSSFFYIIGKQGHTHNHFDYYHQSYHYHYLDTYSFISLLCLCLFDLLLHLCLYFSILIIKISFEILYFKGHFGFSKRTFFKNLGYLEFIVFILFLIPLNLQHLILFLKSTISPFLLYL